MRAWKIAMASTSGLVVAACVLAFFSPLIQTHVSYTATGLEYDGGGFMAGGSVDYDGEAFDDSKYGTALRAIMPLLIVGGVLGVLSMGGALLPRAWGVTASSILGLLAAGAAGGAIGAAWYGSKFADGASSLSDLGPGGWILAVTALVSIVTLVLSMVIGGAIAATRPTRAGEAEPATTAPTATPTIRGVPKQRVNLAPVGSLVLFAMAMVSMSIPLGSGYTAGSKQIHWMWGWQHANGVHTYHDGPGSTVLMMALIVLSLAMMASVVYASGIILKRRGTPRPELTFWAGLATGIGFFLGFALMLAGGMTLHNELSAPTAIGMAGAGLLVTAVSWGPLLWTPEHSGADEPEHTEVS